jgi:hypothetical protein
MFWYTESAVPWNHSGPLFICGGTTVTKCWGMKRVMVQELRMCSIRGFGANV